MDFQGGPAPDRTISIEYYIFVFQLPYLVFMLPVGFRVYRENLPNDMHGNVITMKFEGLEPIGTTSEQKALVAQTDKWQCHQV